jgi:hypothetical protein
MAITGVNIEYQPWLTKNSAACLPEAKPPPKWVVNQTKATLKKTGIEKLLFFSTTNSPSLVFCCI